MTTCSTTSSVPDTVAAVENDSKEEYSRLMQNINLFKTANITGILAFGDSLTEGYTSYPPPSGPGSSDDGKVHPKRAKRIHMEPYSNFMMEEFKKKDIPTTIHKHGVSGQTTEHMLARLQSQILGGKGEAGSSSITGDNTQFAIVLGGTNDLGASYDVETVMKNLEKITNLLLAARIRVVAVTIPPLQWYIDQGVRLKINAKIRELHKRCPDQVILADFEELFELQKTAANEVRLANEKYWSLDKVHLSTLGYATMGLKLLNIIADFLAAKGADFKPPATTPC